MAQSGRDDPATDAPLFAVSSTDRRVKFVRKHTQVGALNHITTYEVYTADSANSAREFLLGRSVREALYYIIVETPEGNWGLDVNGVYLERLLPWQTDIDSADVVGRTGGGLAALESLRPAAMGQADNFVHTVVCGACGHEWLDGLRYQQITVVKCPRCKKRSSVDSSQYVAIVRQ